MGKGGNLGELEMVVMLAVARLGESAHGAAIRKEIEDATGRDITQATVYVTLSRLERKRRIRFVAGLAGEAEGGRPRKLYRVTLEGILDLQTVRIAHARLWQGVPFDPLPGPETGTTPYTGTTPFG